MKKIKLWLWKRNVNMDADAVMNMVVGMKMIMAV